MAKTETVIADEFGEILTAEIDDEAKGVLRHVFRPRSSERHVLVVTADAPGRIAAVTVNGRELERRFTERQEFWVLSIDEKAGELDVAIHLGDLSHSTVHAGLFARIARRVKSSLHYALGKARDGCLLCQMLVRASLSIATGGGDLTGDVLQAAIEEALARLGEEIQDTVLSEIMERLRSVTRMVNPSRLVAKKLCQELGYCP